MFEFAKVQYRLKGDAFLPTLKIFVEKGRITKEQYKEITGKAYK